MLHSRPQVEDTRVVYEPEMPALPWGLLHWQHALDRARLHIVVEQQAAQLPEGSIRSD
jgi:hypothetical protein